MLDVKKCPEEPKPKRAKYSRDVDFLLSLIGYGVGLSNIWRFPYLCARNGGAVFLIPYAIFMVILAFPITFLELSLGQYSGKSTYDLWDICPIFRGVGVAMSSISCVFSFYYNTILAWILYYLVHSFMSPLPWTTCDNWWNTDNCFVRNKINNVSIYIQLNNTNTSFDYRVLANQSMVNEEGIWSNLTSNTTGVSTASEEFWNYNVLRKSSGLDDFGTMQWHLVLCLGVGWCIIFLCLIKGVKSAGKVVYITATLPYIIITIILIRAVTLPGASKGLEFYLIPDLSKLANIQVWVQALMMIYFSMGQGWGAFITMASYSRFKNNILRDTIIFSIMCEGTSFYAGFVVFSVLGFMSHETGLEVADIIRTGPGLTFITYPEALAQLPIPQLWAVLFFIMMLCVALDSMFVSVEVCVSTICDLLPRATTKMRLIVTGTACFIMFLCTLIYTTQAGIYIFQLVDWYMASVSVFIITILECVVVSWIYGADRYLSDLEMMLGKRPSTLFKYMWRYMNPLLLAGVLVFTLSQYQPPTYGNYHYPSYSAGIGWTIALITTVPIPVWMLIDILKRKGPILQRLKTSFQCNEKWGPAKDYEITDLSEEDTQI